MDSSDTFRPQLRSLTSLRFFAAISVVLFHLPATAAFVATSWWYRHLASMGYIGVSCFFVLSGFVLAYTYAGTAWDVRRFWQARFARVYPAYAFSLAVTLPLFLFAMHVHAPVFAWSERHLAVACLLAIGLLQAWVPLGALTWNPVCWSLSAEAFFYLIFPWLLGWAKGLTARGLAVGMTACSLCSLTFSVAYTVLHPDGMDLSGSDPNTSLWKSVLDFNPLVRAPEFITGVLAGCLFIQGRVSPRAGGMLAAAGLAVLAVLVALAHHVPDPLISPAFLSPAFAALILGLAHKPRWGRVLEARWLVRLGEASYSLYLLHSLVVLVAFNLVPGLPAGLRVIFSLAAAICAALLCFTVVEQPARRLLRPGRKGRQPAAQPRIATPEA
jgi:peptidoglycan/LPS O-acetylase OafA/YrhL